MKDSKVRELILNSYHTLLVPEVHFQEIEEHKDELVRKSGLFEEEFGVLLNKLSEYFIIVKNEKITSFIKEAENLIGRIDKDDIPIIATSLAYNNCLIWSDDKHFKKQDKIKVLKTADIIRIMENLDNI